MGNQRDNYWVILCKNTYLLTRFLYPQVKGIMKTSQINKAKGAGGQGGRQVSAAAAASSRDWPGQLTHAPNVAFWLLKSLTLAAAVCVCE